MTRNKIRSRDAKAVEGVKEKQNLAEERRRRRNLKNGKMGKWERASSNKYLSYQPTSK
jgi:hypothetical protein